ncbi:MAG: alanine/ornithine racemase family PLP-dependent enzyme [archaeon]|nr:alanine/ornithine racemase family PLP-dependent enzyme [archaeon]
MPYPRIEIDLEKIRHNTRIIIEMCKEFNIQVAAVTKAVCGSPEIAQIYVDEGVSMLADSRIENIRKLKYINIPKMFLRLPMISECDEVVELTDVSLNSEIKTIKILSQKAIERGKIHNIILMIDLGDLREGIFKEELVFAVVEEILLLKGIKLLGIGVNLTCFGAVIPTREKMDELIQIKEKIEEKFEIKIEILSGGNSSNIPLIQSKKMPKQINQLRIGDALITGREPAYFTLINDTYHDCFKLKAEIIEIQEKPSIPIGEIGFDAFGKKPIFVDKGIRKRAICAIGKQDINTEDLILEDQKIDILGQSSDHLILDIDNSSNMYVVGDIISFNLNYVGILRLFTSEYVKKFYL